MRRIERAGGNHGEPVHSPPSRRDQFQTAAVTRMMFPVADWVPVTLKVPVTIFRFKSQEPHAHLEIKHDHDCFETGLEDLVLTRPEIEKYEATIGIVAETKQAPLQPPPPGPRDARPDPAHPRSTIGTASTWNSSATFMRTACRLHRRFSSAS